MNGGERNIIKNNLEHFVANTINENALYESLFNRGIFNQYIDEDFRSIKFRDREKKLRYLYETLITRGPAAFEHLISALFETNNDLLGKQLLRERYKTEDYLKINVRPSRRRLDIDEGIEIAYRMGSKPKGHALIINIHDFCNSQDPDEFKNENFPVFDKGSRRRNGSYRDVANLYTLLTGLGYKTTILYDVTKAKLFEEIEKFRDKPEHSNVSSCMFIIMSHGNKVNDRFVLTTFDEEQVPCSDIWKMFTSDKCPKLHNKPKIFLFQVCRGDENDMGVAVSYGMDSNLVKFSHGNSGTLSQQMSRAVSDVAQLRPADYEIPRRESSHQDFILIYPSAPGTTSKRNVTDGAWLIQTICKVFMEHACDHDIASLIIKVRSEIDKLYDKTIAKFGGSLDGTQTTWSEGSAKKIFFNPGLYDDQDAQNNNSNCKDVDSF